MKSRILFLVLIIASLNCLGQKKVPKQYQDTIIWRKGYVLKREDFKSKPLGNYPVQTGTTMIISTMEKDGTIIFVVASVFFGKSSFIKSESDYLLKHEQNNFDLCEVHARRLRKKIASKNFNKTKNIRADLAEMYEDANKEYHNERLKYEKETEFGLNAVKQAGWNERVQKELSELSNYESLEVNISGK